MICVKLFDIIFDNTKKYGHIEKWMMVILHGELPM